MQQPTDQAAQPVLLIDTPGPRRATLAKVLQTLLPIPLHVLPQEVAPPLAVDELLRAISAKQARSIVLSADALIPEGDSGDSLSGLGLLWEIARRKLADFRVIILSSRPVEKLDVSDRAWVEKLLSETDSLFLPSRGPLPAIIEGCLADVGEGEVGKRRRSKGLAQIQGQLEQAARRRFDQAASDDRHRLANRRSAARLLFGAFAAGDIDQPGYHKALVRLNGGIEINPSGMDVPRHIERMKRLAGKLPREERIPAHGRRLSESVADNRRVLVIDDEVIGAGWEAFFDALFPGKVDYACSVDEGQQRLAMNSGRLELVFLDLQLPNRPEEGMAALRLIKRLHPDLPVIVFSAVDTVRYAAECVRLGADHYWLIRESRVAKG